MAIAPESTGIGLVRHFTRPDVHPYDTVLWERRDARITNWKDGSVAFEQLDVEVPSTWSVNATNILSQKYFRGTLGTPERESSLRQVADRVVDTLTTWGMKDGYFVDEEEAETFRAELKYLIIHQKAAFNSPVWFNIGVKGVPQQGSACFILAVDDSMDSILNWYREEGTIFKGGSGAGVNLSKIRSSVELLNGGGTASGPVSFMRGADASAGTIKSGGKTRRAAKMVILNAEHPDIEDFIWCKAREERKARVLRDAGFDMDLDGKDSISIQYQNANNSVRVTDEFMQAVVDDGDWALRAVTDGAVMRTVKARDLYRQIMQATWECADPGMQFDTTINHWHTAHEDGRINGSNPCFTADTLVHTDKGLIRFDDLFGRANQGEAFQVYTHDVTNADAPAQQTLLTTPEAFMITGRNPIVRLRFDSGLEVRCTPGHRIFTTNRGYVEAENLTVDDKVRSLDLPTPAVNADWAIPSVAVAAAARQSGERFGDLEVPEVWDTDLGHYLGWLIGDGSTSNDTTCTIYGSAEDRDEIMPTHADVLESFTGGRPLKVSEQSNGTAQLRLARRSFKRFIEALGVASVTGEHKRVPWAIQQAPTEIAAAFLRGLFDADGTVVHNDAKGSYVGLASISRSLLIDVQQLLSTFGITSRVYGTGAEGTQERPTGTYVRHAGYQLRITSGAVERFAAEIGFGLSRKAALLAEVVASRTPYAVDTTVRLVDRTDEGIELTYNLKEPRNHSYVANGVIVRNCSEYMHVDNSACNLASLNLLTFLEEDGSFDIAGYKRAIEVVFTGQEILVGNGDYPTEKIAQNSRKFRQLGLGYANIGALLMAQGLPYDSDGGRAWAGALTALMTGHAYATSARTAARMGPFAGFTKNRDHMLRVLGQHRDEVAKIDEELVPTDLLSAAQEAWEEAVELGEAYGVRNAQASVLAPTGCLVGGSLVATERGLVRLATLGDPDGPQWQDLDTGVATDEGRRDATKFYVNGLETVVDVRTERGYAISGTTKHRIKVIDEAGNWVWRRFADVRPGDRVPLALDQLVGTPQEVRLPRLGEAYWAGEHHVRVPETMTDELAELVGYFMGDGSLHARGIRLCVANTDLDVVDHLVRTAKSLFGIEAAVAAKQGYTEVALHSVRLVDWWHACGFAKHSPSEGHVGKGWSPHIPHVVLHTNDREVYRSFLRGLYEADGTVTAGYPSWTTTTRSFADDVRSLMLALGYPTTTREQTSGRGSELHVLRLLNLATAERFGVEVGFLSSRKQLALGTGDHPQAARYDHIPVSRELIDRVCPVNNRNRKIALMEHKRGGGITRRLALELVAATADAELSHLVGFFYDRVASAELGDEELTYDISVPENVTYLANGFVSHNTIGLLMDCDTTGVEPDLSLVKTKKLVGGGTMSIVNQTIPRALRRLGYDDAQVEDIVAYIDEHKSIVGAPYLAPEHLPVFACSMGDNTIHYLGHVRMMAAAQPFISGAISKTVNLPEDATVEDVEQLHIDAWRMGIKAIAIYRDNCKVGQPLSTTKTDAAIAAEDADAAAASVGAPPPSELTKKIAELEQALERQVVVVKQPQRERLPRRRRSNTFKFRVADCEGYVTVSEYDDGRPGEVFIKVSKQGSTLAGVMDAFSISISLGLQHGVPLSTYVSKYTNMKFEPAGMTDDPELRLATSLVDYIFRRMAVDYMPRAEREEIGILTTGERMQPTLPGVEEAVTVNENSHDPEVATPELPQTLHRQPQLDAPLCMQCGTTMQRAGSCYVCAGCGTTSGCS
jgi:ribonucleoside-diphosphate reductase alpha chain